MRIDLDASGLPFLRPPCVSASVPWVGRALFYSDVPLMLPGAGHAGLFSVSSFFFLLAFGLMQTIVILSGA
jgi:hypothetical protein